MERNAQGIAERLQIAGVRLVTDVLHPHVQGLYAELQGYQKQQKLCPYETDSHRTAIKHLYEEMERISPEVRYSIWGALEADNKLIEE